MHIEILLFLLPASLAGYCGPLLTSLLFEVEGGFEDAVGRGDLFFLAARDADPEQPDIEIFRFRKGGGARHIGSYFTTGSTLRMALAGDYLYLANGDEGLEVVDVRRPDQPRSVTRLPLDGYTHQVRLRGGLAYLASGFGGLHVVDISDPRRPRLVATYRAFPMPVDQTGNDDDGGLFPKLGEAPVAALTEAGQDYYEADDLPAYEGPEEDVPPGEFAAREGVLDVALGRDRAYLAYASAGLYVLDISDPRRPSMLGSLRLAAPVETVRLNGARLQVTAGIAGVQTIDVSDPAAPRSLGELRTICYPQDLAGTRNYAYVADGYCGSDGLLVMDMRNDEPVLLESLPGVVGNVSVSGDRLFSMGLEKTRVYALPR